MEQKDGILSPPAEKEEKSTRRKEEFFKPKDGRKAVCSGRREGERADSRWGGPTACFLKKSKFLVFGRAEDAGIGKNAEQEQFMKERRGTSGRGGHRDLYYYSEKEDVAEGLSGGVLHSQAFGQIWGGKCKGTNSRLLEVTPPRKAKQRADDPQCRDMFSHWKGRFRRPGFGRKKKSGKRTSKKWKGSRLSRHEQAFQTLTGVANWRKRGWASWQGGRGGADEIRCAGLGRSCDGGGGWPMGENQGGVVQDLWAGPPFAGIWTKTSMGFRESWHRKTNRRKQRGGRAVNTKNSHGN